MKPTLERVLPWVALLVGVAIVAAAMVPHHDPGPMEMDRFGQIPVSADGRVKPLDTVARNSLMIISGRQTLRVAGKEMSATRWLADLITRPEVAAEYEVFRIDHPDVLALVGLKEGDGGRNRVKFSLLWEHHEAISQQAEKAQQVDTKAQNAYQKHLLELYNHLNLYVGLSQMVHPFVVPPVKAGEEWRPMTVALEEFQKTKEEPRAALSISSILDAYQHDNAGSFNREVAGYITFLESLIPRDVTKARFEVFFNQFQPFYQTAILYVIVLLLVGASWLGWSAPLRKAALWVLLLALAVHTFGLVSRIYLQGRPPVTNLYSSAIFIGWVVILLALAVEYFQRNGLGLFCAALLGFATGVIAHNLATGDTMEMMQAVLDTNFWLATHVVAVTTGYASTFLAGFLGIVFIVRGVFTRSLGESEWKDMGRAIYGVICFAMLFSFVGTVLGGIWADQSWGRFWGWDPKENGAALIVAMNALTLHARWGGMIQQRGMAVLAVVGNIVTAWSWFGTNMLGVGLHSYGFMESAVFWILAFVASQLVIIAIGLIPPRYWRSVSERTAAPEKPAASRPRGKTVTA